ncbi:GntR family transcriptional regulator [Rhodovibrionaceae bacterium A322]
MNQTDTSVLDGAGKPRNPDGGSQVDRLYESVKSMAVGFDLKPGERVNEVTLAKQLGASRTPLREALNRLTSEGLLVFEKGRGFFCRQLDPKEIFDLYQTRAALEEAAIRLACHQISDQTLDELETFLDRTKPGDAAQDPRVLVDYDEYFHEQLIAASGNREMLRILHNLNTRIRFVRWIDMERRRSETQSEHRNLLAALRQRNADAAAQILRDHIAKRQDQITQAVREGFSRLYVPVQPE